MNWINKGDIIRKSNFTKLKKRPQATKSQPDLDGKLYLAVNSVARQHSFLLINGEYLVNPQQIEKIEIHEALEMDRVWDECELGECKKPDEKSSCYRDDNGEPKQKFTSFDNLKRVLFTFRMRYPEDNFQGYPCPTCSHYHIGKLKLEEV